MKTFKKTEVQDLQDKFLMQIREASRVVRADFGHICSLNHVGMATGGSHSKM